MKRFSALVLLCGGLSHFAAAQTFTSAHRFHTPEAPNQTMAVDVNHDGYADLVVLQPNSQSIVVRLNNHNGGFSTNQFYFAGTSATGFVVADFNQDGIVDIAVAVAKGVALLRGTSSATFQTPVVYATDGAPNSIAYGDFNNDGKKDVATLSDNGKLSILLNTGSGFGLSSFRVPMDYNSGGIMDRVFLLTAGDYNADGRTDLAFIDECQDDSICNPVPLETLQALFRTATGWKAQAAAHGSGAMTLRAFDVDNDGRTDLLVSYYGCYHETCTGIAAEYSNPDGTFTGVGVISGNGGGGDPFDAVVADFNNDGILDVAGPVERGIDPIHFYEVNDGFAVYTGKPGGRSFNDPVYFSVSSTASTARMIDTGFFTHQGKKDVLLTEGFTAAIDTFWNTTSRLGDPCPYPINIGVTFCSPATGATLASPVRFRASAHVATQPANRIELWIDGHKRFQTFSDLLDRKIALASGTHTVTVISVDAAGKLIKKSIAIRVP